MSDETKKPEERTIESLHRDYSQACADAGHLQYAIKVHKDDITILEAQLEELNKKRRDLNLEATALQAKAKTNE